METLRHTYVKLKNAAPLWEKLLTNCVQEVVVMCERHERIWQLPQPLLDQARHSMDGIIFKADQVGVWRHKQDNKTPSRVITFYALLTAANWKGLTGLQSLVKLFYAVGGARLAVDALGVQAVHLHMLQHHLQHHGHWVFIADQMAHSHPEVLTTRIFITLDSDRH